MNLPRHVRIGIGVAAVVAIVVGVLLYMNLSSPRARTITVQRKAPSVDEAKARQEVDRRIAEYRAKGEPVVVTDLKPKPVDPKQNAAEPLMAAMKWLDTPEVGKHPSWNLDMSAKLTDKQWQIVDDAVNKFAPALALIDQADGRDAADWKIEYKSPAMTILLRSLNGARQSANLLNMAALSAHRAGRDDETVRRITQMIRLARHVDDGHPFLVGHLVGCGIARLSTDAIAHIVPTLKIAPATTATTQNGGAASRRQIDDLIAALLDARTLGHGWTQAALAERMSMIDTQENVIMGKLRPSEILAGQRAKQAASEPAPPTADLLADLAIMLDYGTAVANATKAQRLPDFRQRQPAEPTGLSAVSMGLIATYDRAGLTHYTAVAHLRVAAIALAIRAWSFDHNGALPVSLNDLVPKYLPVVPPDPLVADPAVISYRTSPDPMVYSTGSGSTARRTATARGPNPDVAIRLSSRQK